MDRERKAILLWTEQGRLPPERAREAMQLLHALPDSNAWRSFIDRLLLWSGATLLAVGVIFFIAFNWNILGRFMRFGLVEALLAAAVAAAVWLGPERAQGKAALFTAALLTGALLALFGQSYQTGADTWQLFFAWAVLLLPWTLAGRHAPLWMLLLILLEVALTLYLGYSGRFHLYAWSDGPLWVLFGFNTLALAAWEAGASRFDWLARRWGPRLLALASGSLITTLAMVGIFDHEERALALPLYALWLAGIYVAYRRRRPDLFMLAGGALSAVVVITALLAGALFDSHFHEGALLVIALAVIGMSAAAGRWLMAIAREEPREA